MSAPPPTERTRSRADVVGAAGFVALFAAAWIAAAEFPPRAAIFPRLISLAGCAVATLALLQAWRGARPRAEVEDDPDLVDDAAFFRSASWRQWLPACVWGAAFVGGLWMIGTLPTITVFTAAYLRIAGRARWRLVVPYTIVWYVLIDRLFGDVLHLQLP